MSTTAESTTTVTPTRVDPTWAWTLAASPMVFAVLPLAFPGLDGSLITIVAICANTLLAVADWNRLDKAGVRISFFWPLLLVPVYLVLRTVRAKATPAIPVVWVLSVLASVIIGNQVAAHGPVQMDPFRVEDQLTRGIKQQTGESVGVDCPDPGKVPVGSSFVCTVRASDGVYHAHVTVADADGRYTWTLTR